jgi:hypothetical protein
MLVGLAVLKDPGIDAAFWVIAFVSGGLRGNGWQRYCQRPPGPVSPTNSSSSPQRSHVDQIRNDSTNQENDAAKWLSWTI